MRLAGLLLLNAAVLGAAWFAARRWASDPMQRLMDTLLLWYAIQYVAVCVPGALHVLSPWMMAIAALLVSAGLFAACRVRGKPEKKWWHGRLAHVFFGQKHGRDAHATEKFPSSHFKSPGFTPFVYPPP